MDVVKQVPDVTADNIMWIQVWGARGGKGGGPSDIISPGDGGAGGYAQTTTTVNDLAGINNPSRQLFSFRNSGSTQLFYYLGEEGGNDGDHCGGQGGSSTFVSLQDLTPNPSTNPTQSVPPFLLIAAGGGGGGAANGQFGCAPPSGGNGGAGGVAIAKQFEPAEGMGGQSGTCGTDGGNGGSFGGRGGAGGSGEDCNSTNAPEWTNTEIALTFADGQGDVGGSGTNTCDAGGGGGGGGWGGGQGGSHGNDADTPCGGGGGGSAAIESTQESDLAPTTTPGNPCSNSSAGCVQIQFEFTP